jgi:hypothetical protein
MLKKKTWSTESAWVLIGMLCFVVFKENIELVKVIIWPFTTYAAVAFGLKRVDTSDKLWVKPS